MLVLSGGACERSDPQSEVNTNAAIDAKRVYAVGRENAAVLDTYGWILLERRQDELAIENLSRAADLAPQAPEIRYHLAGALVASRQLPAREK